MKRHLSETTDLKKSKKVLKYLTEAKLNELSSEFLCNKKHANVLIDILDQFKKPTETPAICISTVEKIFTEVLKRRELAAVDRENASEAELQYREWLADCYEEAWRKIALCLQRSKVGSKLQAFNSLCKLLSTQAKFPIKKEKKKKKKNKNNFPVNRLTEILQAMSLSSDLSEVLERWSEVANYKDIHSNTWLAVKNVLSISGEQKPKERIIWNILLVLSKLPKPSKEPDILMCDVANVVPAERVVTTAVSEVWNQLARWQYSSRTHQLLLVVLVGHIMPAMDNIIFLTDYLMDALAREECEINILALQGIFNLVLKHNIEYPDIFGKLYQLFTVNALKAKYKTRLFVLADEFLRSTHLPLALVAAFAKRFSRLLLSATPPDALVLMALITNLLIRHSGLKFLYHKPAGKDVVDDPYVEDEKDPLKSRATESQLFEVKLMQHHYMDRVAKKAMFINDDLPRVECELDHLFELTWNKMIRKDVKQLKKSIASKLDKFPEKPPSSKTEETRRKEIELLFTDLKKYFVFS